MKLTGVLFAPILFEFARDHNRPAEVHNQQATEKAGGGKKSGNKALLRERQAKTNKHPDDYGNGDSKNGN